MSSFGELLSELRKDNQEKQLDIARLLNVSPGTVSNYETSTHLPDLETIKILADHFNVSTDYLLGRTSSKLSPKILGEQYIDALSYGQMVEKLKKLSPRSKSVLLDVINALIIKDMVQSPDNIAGGLPYK